MWAAALIASGCQQWIRHPAALHEKGCFAVASSLAVAVWACSGSSGGASLRALLPQAGLHVRALAWNPVDERLLAVATADQHIKVYNLDDQNVLRVCTLPGQDPVSRLAWTQHDEACLLVTAGSSLLLWHTGSSRGSTPAAGSVRELHAFGAVITCAQQSASAPQVAVVGTEEGRVHVLSLIAARVGAPACAHCL